VSAPADRERRSRRARLHGAWAASLLLLTGACGWHAGLQAPEGVRSVGVMVVQRKDKVLERGLEPLLTDAVSEAVVNWVDLPLLDPGEADLIVQTELLEYRRRGGVRNEDNELLESAVFVRASAELIDRRTNEAVGNPVVAQQWSGYALDDVTNEDDARDRALRNVAASLVLELFAPDPSSNAR
jgi:hypothetical protein